MPAKPKLIREQVLQGKANTVSTGEPEVNGTRMTARILAKIAVAAERVPEKRGGRVDGCLAFGCWACVAARDRDAIDFILLVSFSCYGNACDGTREARGVATTENHFRLTLYVGRYVGRSRAKVEGKSLRGDLALSIEIREIGWLAAIGNDGKAHAQKGVGNGGIEAGG